jgi:hypothetical protein
VQIKRQYPVVAAIQVDKFARRVTARRLLWVGPEAGDLRSCPVIVRRVILQAGNE